MDGADGERPLPRRRGCAASNLSIRRFSLPRRKSLADAIDCTYVCTPPFGGGGRGRGVGRGWTREVDADPTEGVVVAKKHGMIGDVSLLLLTLPYGYLLICAASFALLQ